MRIDRLELDFFRNYVHGEADFAPDVNVIYGDNAQGKTNLLEAIAYQVTDLMLAMRQDAGCDITCLRADGGASVSNILLQLQSDLLRIPVDRPEMVETTAFGAAALAGLSCGFWESLEELASLRRSERTFTPQRVQAECDADYHLWKRAVQRAADWIEH